jgi:ADP-ribose pyrophosphatase YjhB (NUDIX family)
MKYCSECARPLAFKIPLDDNRERFVCEHCDMVHYQNPRVVVGCLPVYEGRILLCRRAIEPRKNYWTLPAGFMENGETTEEGARRETREEACATVSKPRLYTLFDLPHISQIYMFYLGDLVGGEFGVGAETLESKLFLPEDIPWDQLAFPVVGQTLRYYIEDSVSGEFPVRNEVISYPWGKRPQQE